MSAMRPACVGSRAISWAWSSIPVMTGINTAARLR
jgi:hypothetical protein